MRIRETRPYVDDVGQMVTQTYRASDSDWFAGYADFYFMTLKKGGVRDFHYHKTGIDTFTVLTGTSRIVFYDMREDSPTKGQIQEFVLTVEKGKTLFFQVPPYVSHGFQGVSDESLLIDLPSKEELGTTDFHANKPGSVPYEFPQV